MALTPVVPLAGRLRNSGPRVECGRDVEVPAYEQVPSQEAATRTVPRRSSESRFPTGSLSSGAWRCWVSCSCLQIIGLGPKAPHAHSLIQLWADASQRERRSSPRPRAALRLVRRSRPHGLTQPSARRIATGPVILMTSARRRRRNKSRRPVSSGVHLLLMSHDGDQSSWGCGQAPIDVPDRARTGLSPRILVPPPRWTPVAS